MINLSKDHDNVGVWRAITSTSDTSDYVVIRPSAVRISVGLYPEASARGYVEYTISSAALLDSGNAVWIKWPLKNRRVDTIDGIISTVTAVRAVAITGTVQMEVVTQ